MLGNNRLINHCHMNETPQADKCFITEIIAKVSNYCSTVIVRLHKRNIIEDKIRNNWEVM